MLCTFDNLPYVLSNCWTCYLATSGWLQSRLSITHDLVVLSYSWYICLICYVSYEQFTIMIIAVTYAGLIPRRGGKGSPTCRYHHRTEMRNPWTISRVFWKWLLCFEDKERAAQSDCIAQQSMIVKMVDNHFLVNLASEMAGTELVTSESSLWHYSDAIWNLDITVLSIYAMEYRNNDMFALIEDPLGVTFYFQYLPIANDLLDVSRMFYLLPSFSRSILP